MAAGSIIIDLLMRTGSFETDTGRAEKRLRQFEKNVVDAGTRIATGVAAITAAIGGSIALVDQFAQSIGVYQDISEKIGDSAQNVASLQLAADTSGTALDTVASASIKLTAALSKVDEESSGVAKALAAINLPIDEFKKLSPVEQIDAVARSFAKFEDGAGKTAVAVALFGKSGAELIPFLNDLADTQERNITLTDDQIAAADQFSKTLAGLQSELATAAKIVASNLLPSFQAFLDYIKDSEVGLTLLNAAGAVFKTVFEAIAIVAANVAFVFVSVGREIGAVIAQLKALVTLDISGYNAISKAVREDGARARAELDKLQKNILGSGARAAAVSPVRPAITANFGNSGGGRSSGGSASAPRQSEADRYLESLQKQLERTKELTVVEQLLTDIQAGRLGKVNSAQQAALVGIASQIDAAKALKEQEQARLEQQRELQASEDSLSRMGAAVYESTRTELEKLTAEEARLSELLQADAINWDTYARAVDAARESYKATTDTAKVVGDEIDEFSKNAARSIQDSIGDGLVDAMNGNFKNIGDSFTKLLQRLVAESLATDITRALFGRAGGGEGSGFFGDALGAIGGFFGFGGARAAGGDVMSNRAYLVGEQGPEMFVPRTSGMILPSSQTTNSSRATTNNITVNVPQSTPRGTGLQIGAEISRKLAMSNARGN